MNEIPNEFQKSVSATIPSEGEVYKEWSGSHGELLTTVGTKTFRKTLRLNSDRLAQLALKSGVNDVEFSVTTRLQVRRYSF